MTDSSVTIVLAVQIALLLGIAIQFRRRLQSGEDFVLARRRLSLPYSGAVLAMNSVPIWWLLTLIVVAFTTGVGAVWLALALLGGVIVGGWYLAPRLRALTNLQQRGTFSELLVGDAGERMRNLLLRSTLLIISITLIVAGVAQLQLAAQLLNAEFGLATVTVIVGAGAVICVSLLFAGLWTLAAVDVWQVTVFLLILLTAALALCIGVARSPVEDIQLLRGDWFADNQGLLVVSFIVGVAFISGDAVGQAPLLTRYMACSSDTELKRARNYSLLWAAVTLPLALWIGWSARSLSGFAVPSIGAFSAALSTTLSPSVVTLLLLLLVGTATAAIGHCMHSAASHLANDLRRGGIPISLTHCRLWLILTVAAIVIAANSVPIAPATVNFERLLFCWHALGASFGPLLIVRLSGKRVRPGSCLGSIWSGYLLTLVFYLMPDTPGELLERGLPFAAALGIALSGGERRRNPDRADRGERTVHDRLPI